MKYRVYMTQYIDVELDETKFTEEFMEEFRDMMYNYTTIEEHVEHLAQLKARGLIEHFNPFIEGYGPASDMGINISEPEICDIDAIKKLS